MKLSIIIIALILCSTIAFAQLEYFVTTTTILPDGSSSTRISITLQENYSSFFELSIFDAKTETIFTNATFPRFFCESEDTALGTDLNCDVSQAQGTDRSFSIEFQNNRIVTQDGQTSLLEQEFLIPYKTEHLVIKATLPEGTVIQQGQEYLPSYGRVSSDGRRIEVIWKDDDVLANYHVSLKIPYEPLPFSIPVEFIIIIIILIAVVLYLLNKRRKAPLLMPILKTDEKLVLKGVLRHGDGVNQKILVRESGYSKAKVSKVLKSLTDRKIVTLERVGRTNKVHINKNIGKETQKTSGNN